MTTRNEPEAPVRQPGRSEYMGTGIKRGANCASLFFIAVILSMVAGAAHAGSVWLSGDGYIPEPNEEVTVQIETDASLLYMGATAIVCGDMTLTSAMGITDAADYGWDPNWASDPYIDPNGSVRLDAVEWQDDTTGIVGYFKFIYHGGEVVVALTGEAYDTNWNVVSYSSKSLSFGIPEPEPNQPTTTTTPPDVNSPPTPSERPSDFLTYLRAKRAWQIPQDTNSLLSQGMMSFSSLTYEPNTVLTENTIWSQDVVLSGQLYVEGCQLVIMPGVTVWNASDTSGGIIVRNGGAIVANGSNERRIIFRPLLPWSQQHGYPFAIKMESTASTSSSISYCYILVAQNGLWIDNCRLEKPITQVHIEWCGNGIYQEGPKLTDLYNNEIINALWSGIEIWLMQPDDPNNTSSADTYISMEHNSIIGWWQDGIQGQDCGITIHGSPQESTAGFVAMADNLIAGSFWFAIFRPDGWVVTPGRYNHGYYNNYGIDLEEYYTGIPWGEINPKYADSCPFYNGYYTWPYLLDPSSNFVDGGAMTVEETGYLIGQSTFYGIPDVNMADIGFHYNFVGYVNAGVNPLVSDFNNDLGVDANDVMLFAQQWLLDPNSPNYDPKMNFDNEDCINFRDFAIVAGDWKRRTPAFPSDTPPTFDQDPNNLKGDVKISVAALDYIGRTWVLVDGTIVGECWRAVETSDTVLETRRLTNGIHEVKIIYASAENFFITTPVNVDVNNVFSVVTSSDSFEKGSGYWCYAITEPNVMASVEIYDMDDALVFSQTCEGGIDVNVPASVFSNEYGLYTLRISEAGQMAAGYSLNAYAASSGNNSFEELLSKTFNRKDPAIQNARMVFSIGSPDILTRDDKYRTLMRAKVNAAVARNLSPIVLGYDQCTFTNLHDALTLPNVKLWDHTSHAGWYTWYGPLPIFRHFIEINGGRIYSHAGRGTGPYDIAGLGIVTSENEHPKCKLNWVSFTGCWTFENNEFPSDLGIYSSLEHTGADKVFIGWRHEYIDTPNLCLKFDIEFWNALGTGSTISEAYAYSRTPEKLNSAEYNYVGISWRYLGPMNATAKLSSSLQ
jgi:hypothetical protein